MCSRRERKFDRNYLFIAAYLPTTAPVTLCAFRGPASPMRARMMAAMTDRVRIPRFFAGVIARGESQGARFDLRSRNVSPPRARNFRSATRVLRPLSPFTRSLFRCARAGSLTRASGARAAAAAVCQKCSARQLGARSSKLAPAATVRPHRECPLCSAAAHRALRTKRGLPRTAVTRCFKAGALNFARIAASLAGL